MATHPYGFRLGLDSWNTIIYINLFIDFQAQIEAAMEQVCTKLPSAFRAECSSLIMSYGPIIINLLKYELEAGQICSSFGLCKNATEGLLLSLINFNI